MSGVRWDILQPVDIGQSFKTGYQVGSEMVRKEQMRGALAAYAQDPTNPQAQSALAALSPEFALKLGTHRQELAEKKAEKQRIGAYFTTPDRAAARQAALQSGEIDIAKQIDSLSKEEREVAADKYKFAAPLAYEAMKLPYEQRKLFIANARPQLEAKGWTAAEIEAFDPSDEALGSIVQTNMTLEQAMERDKINYKEVGPGARLVPFDATGRPVAGAGSPPPIDNAAPAPSSSVPPSTAATGEFQFDAPPGAQVTSAYRDPAHNRKVGGVEGSYHTRKDASGNPMARDFVPPPGMSMGQLHAELARRNPHLDVINEGDHVHIEPKTRQAAAPTNDIRQQAQEAIAAGADPAAVRARAASMGVTL